MYISDQCLLSETSTETIEKASEKLSVLIVHLSVTSIPSRVDKETRLQEPAVLVSVMDATWNKAGSSVMATRDIQPAWTWENNWLGKEHTAQGDYHPLGAIGTESTAIEKTLFFFMPIVMAGMFCLYQHAALDYLNFFLLPMFSSYCLYLIKI